MKFLPLRTVLLLFSSASALAATDDTMRPYMIRHAVPAADWTEANPMGNGRMGAMICGGTHRETIHLNEDTLWSGEPQPHYDGKQCRDHLEQVRELIFAGKHEQATALGQQTMLGVYNQCYQPLGDLNLVLPAIDPAEVTDYARVLDLNQALSATTFGHGEAEYRRTVFVSYPDQVMVVHLTASGESSIDLAVGLDSQLEHTVTADPSGTGLWMSGRAPIHADPHYAGTRVEYDRTPGHRGMRFGVALHLDCPGGIAETKDDRLLVRGADEVTIILSAATSFNGVDRSPSAEGVDERQKAVSILDAARKRGYGVLRQRHVRDHASLFARVDVQFGDTSRQGHPVSDRIGANHQPGRDPDLDELFYQFGRYLLIASSRPGSQPANLQGIWSRKLNPSWSANWTMNCNAQFNYIGAGPARLSELGEPFLRMVREASVDGARVARSWYGAGGWVFHHNLDLWRAAMPVAGNVMWATFPTGGTWSVVELFDLWRFRQDPDVLREMWPLLQGNAAFWLDNLVEDPETGHLVSCPDLYFENAAKKPDGETVLLCAGPVSSTIMIKQSFLDLLEAAGLLGIEEDPLLERVRRALTRFPGLEINRNGEIRQWHRDRDNQWKETDPTQLLVMNAAIYTRQITPRGTPELAAALGRMLERRKLGLGGEGSWRAAFPANTYARLGQGNQCHQVVAAFYRTWANPNLTARFIQADWEIDGNLGMMSAIQECLVQSHAGEVELLPALPDAWRERGFARGIGVRGGGTASFAWENGRVTRWRLEGAPTPSVKVRVNGTLKTPGGHAYIIE